MAKVAVVDDAPEVVEMIGSILRGERYQVVGYTTGEGIEDKLDAEKPDLLILDIVMPGRDGFGILRNLRRRDSTRELPVLVVSSKNQPSDVEWGLLQGASEYLTKPFTPERLVESVRRLVRA